VLAICRKKEKGGGRKKSQCSYIPAVVHPILPKIEDKKRKKRLVGLVLNKGGKKEGRGGGEKWLATSA